MNLVECYQCLGLEPFATIENVNTAYKRLAGPWLGDLHQAHGNKTCLFEDRNANQINTARDWLVAHLKGVVHVNGQDVEKNPAFYQFRPSLHFRVGMLHLRLFGDNRTHGFVYRLQGLVLPEPLLPCFNTGF